MPRHQFTYDKRVKNSPEFSNLYTRWRKKVKLNAAPEFADFESFYRWSMENGYTLGAHLDLIDETKPYSPSNCVWRECRQNKRYVMPEDDKQEWIAKWNRAVNVIRAHYGMKPLGD